MLDLVDLLTRQEMEDLINHNNDMRNTIIKSISLFFISSILPNVHRFLNNEHKMIMLKPFYIQVDKGISLAWYLKDIGELISFTLLSWVVCIILKAIEKYLRKERVMEYERMIVFIKLWREIFYVIFISSVLDFGHYMVAFKRAEWFFLIQTFIFFLMSCYYIFKSFYRR